MNSSPILAVQCAILLIDWSDKLKKFIVFFLIAASLSGCTYQGWVRYPCQEFENWENPECMPPQCEVTGNCTTDLLPGVLDGKE
jgi:hypothetical protein